MNIYFTTALAQTPQLQQPTSLNWRELFSFATESLTYGGQQQLKRLRSSIDAENTRCFLQRDRPSPLGNWSEEEIKGQLWSEQLPQPLKEFVQNNALNAPKRSFSEVLIAFYAWDAQLFGATNFVGRYFQFEVSVKWTLAQMRAERDSSSLANERGDLERAELWTFVENCLANLEMEFPQLMPQLRSIFHNHRDNPMQLLQSVSQWRIDTIQELNSAELFSADHLLGLCAQTLIAADWQRMNRSEGLIALRAMRAQEAR